MYHRLAGASLPKVTVGVAGKAGALITVVTGGAGALTVIGAWRIPAAGGGLPNDVGPGWLGAAGSVDWAATLLVGAGLPSPTALTEDCRRSWASREAI
jgi:hypothetical protein